MSRSPEDYKKSMRKMTQYIVQQGYEKAEEVDTKADEEFKIEKDKFVHTSQVKINEEYAIRENQLLRQMKINTSKLTLEHKLRLLDTKHNNIAILRQQVQQKISYDMENVEHRSKILYLLILEGLYKLLEGNVKIRCKETDISIISGLLSTLQEEYQQHTKQSVSLIIDSHFITDSIRCGVQLFARNNKIFLENTLDSRVDKAIHKRIPVLYTIWHKLPKPN